MKVFLDASVLVRLSLKSDSTGALVALPVLGAPVELVSSAYALQEALQTMSDAEWPPKAAIATVGVLAHMFTMCKLRLRLDLPTVAEVMALQGQCNDKDDLPILADALAEHCDVLLTTDTGLLRSTAGILCQTPEAWVESVKTHPEIAAAVEQAVRPLRPLISQPPTPQP